MNEPDGVASGYIYAFLITITKDLSDSCINGLARAIKTLVRFWHKEKYIIEVPTFKIRTIAKKRLPVLIAEQFKQVIDKCSTLRDKAIVMLLGDTGLRRAEISSLSWGDTELSQVL